MNCNLLGCTRTRGANGSLLCQMHYKRRRLGSPNWDDLQPRRRAKGTGTITKDGYLRYNVDGTMEYEHTLVWEAANGPVPKGYHIHHKDENTSNNKLSNLVCWTASKHKTYHLVQRFKDRCVKPKEID